MTRYLIPAVVLLIALLALQSWRLDTSQTTEALATAENDRLDMAINKMADSHKKELEAINHAQIIHQQKNSDALQRKQKADHAYHLIGEQSTQWTVSLVPGDIVASLCLSPGSCAMPASSDTSGTFSDRGNRAATERGPVLNNQSLRNGIEDLRVSLARCNSKITAINTWSSKIKTGSK